MYASLNRVKAALALAERARARAKSARVAEQRDVLSLRAERFDDRAWSINERLPDTAPLFN